MHPAGGFYTFGKEEINPLSGFISCWSYFIAKLASGTILLHTAVLILQQVIPALAGIDPLALDSAILALFIALNMFDVSIGSAIQGLFLFLKALPIFAVIGIGVSFFKTEHVQASNQLWEGIPTALPLVIFAMTGFESACSISSKIRNARVNAPRAVFISYAIMMSLVVSYQCAVYGLFGPQLGHLSSYREMFPALFNLTLPGSPAAASTLATLFNSAIACSAMGASYGILFSNAWNLHTLAANGHLLGSSLLTKLNRYKIPFYCILIEGSIFLIYMAITRGDQIALQQVSALGTVLAYTVSVIALLRAKIVHKRSDLPLWISLLGAVNCMILIAACIRGLILNGIYALYGFAFLLLIGISMFIITRARTMKQ
jgi:APA family basic amino acid/polyamine antiporter